MNIFVLSTCPIEAANLQCDKHVVKMILESAQIMSAVAIKNGLSSKYKLTHANHPCTIWAGKFRGNYEWLSIHALALCEEYTRRYGRIHKSQEVIEELLKVSKILPEGSSEFVQCLPDELKDKDPIKAYRTYYRTKRFAVWSKTPTPDFYY